MSQKFKLLKEELEKKESSNVIHCIIYTRSDDLDSFMQNNTLVPELIDYLHLNSTTDHILDSNLVYSKCSNSERDKYKLIISNIQSKFDNGIQLSFDDMLAESVQHNSILHYTDSKGVSHLKAIFVYFFNLFLDDKYVLDSESGKYRLR